MRGLLIAKHNGLELVYEGYIVSYDSLHGEEPVYDSVCHLFVNSFLDTRNDDVRELAVPVGTS